MITVGFNHRKKRRFSQYSIQLIRRMQSDWRPPRININDYRIFSCCPIGKGENAAVFKAQDIDGNCVAIKELSGKPKVRLNRGHLLRFKQEAEILELLTRCGSKYPVQFIAFEEAKWQIIMEYLEGKTVEELLLYESLRKMPVEIHARMFLEMCKAVEAIHSAEIIHCDLSESQFMLTEKGIRIFDFGYSIYKAIRGWYEKHQLTAIECRGVVFGNPCYMAPEQAQREKPGKHSDLFSLAILFYWMLMGRYPYNARYLVEHMAAHINQDPIPLGEIKGLTPAQVMVLQGILFKALAKKPEDRQKNVKEFREQLEAFFIEVGFDTRPITLTEYIKIKNALH